MAGRQWFTLLLITSNTGPAITNHNGGSRQSALLLRQVERSLNDPHFGVDPPANAKPGPSQTKQSDRRNLQGRN